MDIHQIILTTYPELTKEDFGKKGTIIIQDDSDGFGAYLRHWGHSKPIPEGLILGKPQA